MLAEMQSVTVLAPPDTTARFREVTFCGLHGGFDVDLFAQEGSVDAPFADVTIAHLPVSIGSKPYETVRPEQIAQRFNAGLVLCGHIHESFVFNGSDGGADLVNPGPIVRRTIVEKDLRPAALLMGSTDLRESRWGQQCKRVHAYAAHDWHLEEMPERLLEVSLTDVREAAKGGQVMVDGSNFDQRLDEFLDALDADTHVPSEVVQRAKKLYHDVSAD
jgi:hypothetical protein